MIEATSIIVISIHALREEGDRCQALGCSRWTESISIHALREEGDRRALCTRVLSVSRQISIHALREEGDSKCDGQMRI